MVFVQSQTEAQVDPFLLPQMIEISLLKSFLNAYLTIFKNKMPFTSLYKAQRQAHKNMLIVFF